MDESALAQVSALSPFQSEGIKVNRRLEMAISKVEKARSQSQPNGFDITAVVGRVDFGGEGDAFLAAWQVIGENARELPHGGERSFQFDPSGFSKDFIEVAVKFPGEPQPQMRDTDTEWDAS